MTQASTCVTRDDARPEDGSVASLITNQKLKAKPKSFRRIETMVFDMLPNPIAPVGAAFMAGTRQQKLASVEMIGSSEVLEESVL
jgi:hypothetical protein